MILFLILKDNKLLTINKYKNVDMFTECFKIKTSLEVYVGTWTIFSLNIL